MFLVEKVVTVFTIAFMIQFTPQEANARLPLIKNIVTDILAKGLQLQKKNNAAQKGQRATSIDLVLQDEVVDLINELHDLGVFYKDLNDEVCLVDFPSQIGDEDVFLCWRSDEEKLCWYHPVEEGYTGRRLIPEYLLNDKTCQTPDE